MICAQKLYHPITPGLIEKFKWNLYFKGNFSAIAVKTLNLWKEIVGIFQGVYYLSVAAAGFLVFIIVLAIVK